MTAMEMRVSKSSRKHRGYSQRPFFHLFPWDKAVKLSLSRRIHAGLPGRCWSWSWFIRISPFLTTTVNFSQT